MAKTYLEIVKYMVESKFNIDGVVDKPDIIGAVFGQTEGLLGSELDLRELQKNGKIGRIEIDVSQSSNKSYGKLHLPASLDRIETCILAAAIESVDRVGPYEARFSVDKIEDTRSEKRRKVLVRAKELLKILMSTEIPDSREISEVVQSELRISEISTYGPDNLPAGPEITKSDEVIIVEGRADVLTLLRNDIANAIAVGGAAANIPKTIISALRSRIPIDQYLNARPQLQNSTQHQRHEQARVQHEQRAPPPPPPAPVSTVPKPVHEPEQQSPGISSLDEDKDELPMIEGDAGITDARAQEEQPAPALESMILSQLSNGLDELAGTLRSRLYDSTGNVIKEMPIRELLVTVQEANNIYGIVLDGVITQRLLELAQQKRIRAIYGIKANQLNKRYSNMVLYTKESGKI